MPSREYINSQDDPPQSKTSLHRTSILHQFTTLATSYSSLIPITLYQLPLLPLQLLQWSLSELLTSSMSTATTTSVAEGKSLWDTTAHALSWTKMANKTKEKLPTAMRSFLQNHTSPPNPSLTSIPTFSKDEYLPTSILLLSAM